MSTIIGAVLMLAPKKAGIVMLNPSISAASILIFFVGSLAHIQGIDSDSYLSRDLS